MSKLNAVLKKYWGYDTFRDPQEKIIQSILDNKDTIALLPTGGGKSICYQIPALVSTGKTIVITPLIALMMDQVNNLKQRGIPALCLHSGMHRNEIDRAMDNFVYGKTKILYISPERISSPLFFERYKKADVSLVAIDEAHCISQWGYDFRPSYFEITKLREAKPNVNFLALTATATAKILDDIQLKLELKNPVLFRKSYRRENIAFTSIITENKEAEINLIVHKLKGSGIIYCRNRKSTMNLSKWLNKKGISSAHYHAGMSGPDRLKTQNEWLKDKHRVIVSTNAFGMGIDKANVRWVMHIDVPPSLEEYYQEAGRAGRDGEKSYVVSIVSQADISAAKDAYETSYPEVEFVKKVYNRLCSHLRLAIGGGQGESYDFNIIAFIEKNKLGVMKTINSLKLLEKEGWIALSDSIFNPPQIKILQDHSLVGSIENGRNNRLEIYAHLLRKYEGLFIDLVKINIDTIAKELDLSSEVVRKELRIMHRELILEYIPESDSPQVHFLRDRPDVKSVSIDKKAYKARKDQSKIRLDAMVEYLTNNSCRQRYILGYFDEDSKNCGQCDICLGSAEESMSKEMKRKVTAHLKKQLRDGNISILKYLSNFPFIYRKRVLAFLQENENEGLIKIKDGVIFDPETNKY